MPTMPRSPSPSAGVPPSLAIPAVVPSSPTPQVDTSSMWAPASSASRLSTSIDSEKASGLIPAMPPSSVTPTT